MALWVLEGSLMLKETKGVGLRVMVLKEETSMPAGPVGEEQVMRTRGCGTARIARRTDSESGGLGGCSGLGSGVDSAVDSGVDPGVEWTLRVRGRRERVIRADISQFSIRQHRLETKERLTPSESIATCVDSPPTCPK